MIDTVLCIITHYINMMDVLCIITHYINMMDGQQRIKILQNHENAWKYIDFLNIEKMCAEILCLKLSSIIQNH